MIIYWLVQGLLTLANAIVSWLPQVSTLPTIGGYDIDSALIAGVGYTYAFATTIWVIKDVLIGALFVWSYYALKLIVRLIIGHRAPA